MAETVPVFPLRTVLFPGGLLPLRIFETRYLDMVSRCARTGGGFVVSAIREGGETGPARFCDIGTLALIHDFRSLPDGLLGIVAAGDCRVHLHGHERLADGLNVAVADRLEPEPAVPLPEEFSDLRSLLESLLRNPDDATFEASQWSDSTWLGYRLAELLPVSVEQKQYLLETTDAVQRLQILRTLAKSLGIAKPV